jgi:signal transduction histidine kinase
MGENGNAWEICVQDNGIGIAPAYATKIFGIFKRLSRGNEGIGLGLALVKRIVERHGGRVWVESEEGQGSRFCFIWPGASKL